MRNLLGRLHARETEELGHIASWWRIPLGVGNRHRQIGQLYRILTDPRAVRTAWDQLTPPEQTLIRHLALDDDATITLAEIEQLLRLDATATRQLAARLYRAGILAREGDGDPVPIGVEPRLLLPRELALLFRRVQDEIEVGDTSQTSLRSLLELLDDAELEESALVWGIRVVPGLRRREDLTAQLLRRVNDPIRISGVAARRRPDAAAIWKRLDAEPNGAPIPYAEAAKAASLAGDGPHERERLRSALAELETALLVWHTYRTDGSRWLFVPHEIRHPQPTAITLQPLTALSDDQVTPEAEPRAPGALAWDLLTLLRALSAPNPPTTARLVDAPKGWQQPLNSRLWTRGERLPPAGYLDFLVHLARDAGLLLTTEHHDGVTWALAPQIRAWRDRSFTEQTRQLIDHWLTNSHWTEGSERRDVAVVGADWIGFRRRLLTILTELAETDRQQQGDNALTTGRWYALETLAAWIAAREPELLGETFAAATAGRSGSDDDGRHAVTAAATTAELETAFFWFNLVEFGASADRRRAVRLSATGLATLEGREPPAFHPNQTPALTSSSSGEILLRHPSPVRVWSLLTFADQRSLAEVATYRLSQASIGRALSAGFDLNQITTFLEKQSGGALPALVAQDLDHWGRGFRRVRARRALLLKTDDPDLTQELVEHLTSSGDAVRDLGDGILLVEVADDRGSDPLGTLLNRLRTAGFTPQWLSGQLLLKRDQPQPTGAQVTASS